MLKSENQLSAVEGVIISNLSETYQSIPHHKFINSGKERVEPTGCYCSGVFAELGTGTTEEGHQLNRALIVR